MGCWDCFCIICGCPFHDFIEDEHNTNWLNNCTVLTTDNKIIHDCEEVSCNVDFEDKQGKRYTLNVPKMCDQYYEKCGTVLHTDCWKFIKNKLGIELMYSHLPIIKLNFKNLLDINYFDITKFQGQDFDFENLYKFKKKYYSFSPLKNTRNSSRIKKIITQLKLKKDTTRKGPPVSATFYKKGTIKIGNDEYFWIISKGKWHRISTKPELIIKEKKKKENIPFIGEYNTKPIFIKSIDKNKVTYITVKIE